LIIEFNNNIKHIDGLNNEEYRILLESVAYQSARKIERLNNKILEDKVEAKKEALIIIEKERKRKRIIQEKIKEVSNLETELLSEKERLDEKLRNIEVELNEAKKINQETKTELEILGDTIKNINHKNKKFKRWGIIGCVCFILFLVTFLFRKEINSLTVVSILGLITGSGWIWGFGSFTINFYKVLKGK
jgi:hypothetical protein